MIYETGLILSPMTEEEGGKGATSTFQMKVRGKPSRIDQKSPYEVFNESVASDLARYLGLPVPDTWVFPIENEYHCIRPELVFGEPPPTEFEIQNALTSDKNFCCGMICCDLWVANNDRKGDNILYDKENERFWLIDFGNSLLYRGESAGIKRLKEIEGDPGKLFDKEYRYSDLLENSSDLTKWINKIESVPDWMIENSVETAKKTLENSEVSDTEVPEITKFLINRKNRIKKIIDELSPSVFENYS